MSLNINNIKTGDNDMKTKLTDSYGNDLLNEAGQVQYKENTMKNYRVTFNDNFKASGEDGVFDVFLAYLTECVNNGDVTAFEFNECARPVQMSKKDLVSTVQSLLSALKDNHLSPEDFMYRLNATYKNFGQVTHENMKGR